MRTLLVTGGAGFIGANLVHHLVRKYPEDRIVVLDLLTYAGSIEHLPQEMLTGAIRGCGSGTATSATPPWSTRW
jgi:dTDP-D-glucose 4,6-dehydratase